MTDQTAIATQSEQDPQIVADLMSPALGVFRPETTVAEATEALRELTRGAIITYCYVTDEAGRLIAHGEVRLQNIAVVPANAGTPRITERKSQ